MILSCRFINVLKQQYKNIYLKTKVTKVEAKKDGLYVTFEGEQCTAINQKNLTNFMCCWQSSKW